MSLFGNNDALLVVPTQNSIANINASDVIGSKIDTSAGNSLYSKVSSILSQVANISKVYPTLADGVQVIAGVGAWQLGSFAVVVPASTITSNFSIYSISIEDYLGGAGAFELILYSGANGAEVEICSTRIYRSGTYGYAGMVNVRTPITLGNSQIKAKLASQTGGSQSLVISIYYNLAI